MNKILTEEDIAREGQEMRCRAALRMIEVPENIIWKFEGPILFQLAHLCCVIDQPMHWRDALRWIHDHRGEIIEHARQQQAIKREDSKPTAARSNQEDDL